MTRIRCPTWVYIQQEKHGREVDNDVIMESRPFCEEGTLPTSIVLRRSPELGVVTHMRVYPDEDSPPHHVHGHYFSDEAEAITDYLERCKRYEVGGM